MATKIIKKSDAQLAWDTRQLGASEEFAEGVDLQTEGSVDAALDLHLISVRLQKQLVKDLKFIAFAHGIGYQPLMRDVLTRFVEHEKKEIMRATVERVELEEKMREQERSASKSPRHTKHKKAA